MKIQCKNTVFSQIYWVHGLGETSCRREQGVHCLRYNLGLNDAPWPEYSLSLKDQFERIEPGSELMAYSLGGLLAIDLLSKVPSLVDRFDKITMIGVPLQGSYLASAACLPVGRLLNDLFGFSEYVKRPQLMRSLARFSPQCQQARYHALLLSTKTKVNWVVGLGNKSENLVCLGLGDGVVEAASAHPMTALLKVKEEGVTLSVDSADVQFYGLLDHYDIKNFSRFNPESVRDLPGYQFWLVADDGFCQQLIFLAAQVQIEPVKQQRLMVNGVAYFLCMVPLNLLSGKIMLRSNAFCYVMSQSLVKEIPKIPLWLTLQFCHPD